MVNDTANAALAKYFQNKHNLSEDNFRRAECELGEDDAPTVWLCGSLPYEIHIQGESYVFSIIKKSFSSHSENKKAAVDRIQWLTLLVTNLQY